MAGAVDTGEIGRTPLLELDLGVDATVYGKAEWFNLGSLDYGGGSVKTRIGKSMLDRLEAGGALDDPGKTIIEASSGNTGAAVARIGTEMGFDVEIVLPDDAGRGKIRAIEAVGAETTFVDSEKGYDAFVMRCRELVKERHDYVYPNQYENPANPGIHAGTTAVEIWRQTGGDVTHFVAGAGTGGTLVGVSHALRPRGVHIHGYEPPETDHDVPGLKHMHSPETFVPDTFEEAAIDAREYVATETAHEWVRRLRDRHADHDIPIVDAGQWTREEVREGLRVDGDFFVGPSSGGCAALVERLDTRGTIGADDVVVVPLPDRGDRYPERDLLAE